jgi:hypothetical protein
MSSVASRHLLILAALLLTLLLIPAVSASAQSGSGSQTRYAAYSVQSSDLNLNFIVNETIQPTSQQGYSLLAVNISGSGNHLYFSKVVNSTFALLPYLPLNNNETFSYGNGNYSLSLSFYKSGTENVQFMGSSWTLTEYAISVSVDSIKGNGELSGTIATFPSQLIYSFSGTFNGTQTLSATLISTSASLADPASPPNYTAVLIATGLVAAAIAAGTFLYFRYRGHGAKATTGAANPLYWVD